MEPDHKTISGGNNEKHGGGNFVLRIRVIEAHSNHTGDFAVKLKAISIEDNEKMYSATSSTKYGTSNPVWNQEFWIGLESKHVRIEIDLLNSHELVEKIILDPSVYRSNKKLFKYSSEHKPASLTISWKLFEEFDSTLQSAVSTVRCRKTSLEPLNKIENFGKQIRVKIRIVEAACSRVGNYFVKLKLFNIETKKQITGITGKTKEQTANPVWNEDFEFTLDIKEQWLQISLYDNNNQVGKIDIDPAIHLSNNCEILRFVGTSNMAYLKILSEINPTVQGTAKPEACLVDSHVEEVEEVIKDEKLINFKIKVLAAQCKHSGDYLVKLKATDKMTEKQETIFVSSVKYNTKHPVWNNEFECVMDVNNYRLEVQLKRKKLLSEELVGIKVLYPENVAESGEDVGEMFQLQNRESTDIDVFLRMSCQLKKRAIESEKELIQNSLPNGSGEQAIEEENLAFRVLVEEAQCNVIADYFVTLKIIDVENKKELYTINSSVRCGTQNPLWNEEFLLALKKPHQRLDVALHQNLHKLLHHSDIVGKVEITPEQITEDGANFKDFLLLRNKDSRKDAFLKINCNLYESENIRSILWPANRLVRTHSMRNLRKSHSDRLTEVSRYESSKNRLSFSRRLEFFYDELLKNIPTPLVRESVTLNTSRATLFANIRNVILGSSASTLQTVNFKFAFEDIKPINWMSYFIQDMKEFEYLILGPKSKNSYVIAPKKQIGNWELSTYEVLGRIIGIAIRHKMRINTHFVFPIYKLLLSRKLTAKDIEMHWDTKKLTDDGRTEFGDLDQEKIDMFVKPISKQIEAMQKGLFLVVSEKLLRVFYENELEVLVSGLPELDLEY